MTEHSHRTPGLRFIPYVSFNVLLSPTTAGEFKCSEEIF